MSRVEASKAMELKNEIDKCEVILRKAKMVMPSGNINDEEKLLEIFGEYSSKRGRSEI